MQPPDEPSNEEARLCALQSLCVLDTPPEERFDRYTRLAKRLFRVPIALVSLVDADRQWFKSRQGLDATETSREISFCGHAILDDSVLVVEDATRDQRFHDNPLVTGAPDIRFYAGVPLPGLNGHKLGTLCIIDREPRELDEDDLESLRDIAGLVASELASLQLATTDELTGLSNRRGFHMLARQALAMSRRCGKPSSLVMIDMDGFKAINDTYGHDAGDRALEAFSAILIDTFRDSDVVGRLGGDEFCALLAGASESEARKAVVRLREVVECHNAQAEEPYDLAFSAGVAECCPMDEDASATMSSADERMYDDKRERRPARIAS